MIHSSSHFTKIISPIAIRSMTLCFLITAIFVNEAHPFYKSMENHDKPHMHGLLTKKTSSPGKIKNTFYFYDNFSQSNTTGDPIPLVSPGSVFFVPADEISCDISLLPSKRYHLSREKNLDNFLYANLNILMLLKEYDALQKELKGILQKPAPTPKTARSNPSRSIYVRKKELDENWYRITQLRLTPSIGHFDQASSAPPKRNRLEYRKQVKLLKEIISRQEKIQFDQNQIDQNETLRTLYETKNLERSWIMEKIIQLIKFMFHKKTEFMVVGATIFFSLKLISFLTKSD